MLLIVIRRTTNENANQRSHWPLYYYPVEKNRTSEDVIEEVATYKEEIDLYPDVGSFINRLYFINGKIWDTEKDIRKIAEIESIIAQADIIDIASLSGKEVKFGATVSVTDEDINQQFTYQIVGENEADIKNKKLSISSPLARALIGKEKGNIVEFSSPKGIKTYSIKSVKFI